MLEVLERAYERVLHDVFGFLAGTYDLHCDAIDYPAVALNEFIKSGYVSLLRRTDKSLVVR